MLAGGASPITRERLVRDVLELGVNRGDTLLVHVSLRKIGWVDGGAPTVVSALREVVGAAGNVVAPTGTEKNSLTSRAHLAQTAGMTPEEMSNYLHRVQPFDPDTTPSGMGAVSEALRNAPGAVRSDHPQSSFAAIGPDAEYLMADHKRDCHLGENSPLAKLYAMDARVLMIGVGYRKCTAFHLAEYRYTEFPPIRAYWCRVKDEVDWIPYQDVVLDDRGFRKIGISMLPRGVSVKIGRVGIAWSRLIPLVQAVDHAQGWMARHRA